MCEEEIKRVIEALEEFEVFEPLGTDKGYVGKMPLITGIMLTPYRLTSFQDVREMTELVEKVLLSGRI